MPPEAGALPLRRLNAACCCPSVAPQARLKGFGVPVVNVKVRRSGLPVRAATAWVVGNGGQVLGHRGPLLLPCCSVPRTLQPPAHAFQGIKACTPPMPPQFFDVNVALSEIDKAKLQ